MTIFVKSKAPLTPKPGLAFAKTMSQRSPTDSLRYMLHHHLSGPEPARPLSRVHASSLTKEGGICPRYYAIHDITGAKQKNEWLSTSENVTFRMGHDFQEQITHTFADMGKAIGHWKCYACAHIHEFCHRPSSCSKCGCKAFKAEEVRFASAISGASCGIDLLLTRGAGRKLLPIEIKTMDKDEFKKLAAPLQEHKLRTSLYLRLISESDHPWSEFVDTTEARILVGSKGGYGCESLDLKQMGLSDRYSPFKEFVVKRDDKWSDEMSWRAKAVKDYRENKVGVPCGVCPTAMSQRAMKCPVKSQCFSGDIPSEYDWAAAYKDKT